MSIDQILALTLFAFAGTFTPGPNNAIATVTGANFGLRAAVPHMFGVPVGFASMLLAAAAGAAAIVLAFPFAAQALKWAGVAYLMWLALLLARSTQTGLPQLSGPFKLPLTFMQSAAFQYLNPKAWMLSVATAGAFFAGDAPLLWGALAALYSGSLRSAASSSGRRSAPHCAAGSCRVSGCVSSTSRWDCCWRPPRCGWHGHSRPMH